MGWDRRRQLGVRTGLRRDWTRLRHRAWRLLCATRQAGHPHRGCIVHDERVRFPHRGQSQSAADRVRVQRQRRWAGAARPHPQGACLRNTGKSQRPISKNWPSALAPRVSESIGPTISARLIKLLRSRTARSSSTFVSTVMSNCPLAGRLRRLSKILASRKRLASRHTGRRSPCAATAWWFLKSHVRVWPVASLSATQANVGFRGQSGSRRRTIETTRMTHTRPSAVAVPPH
jgi:hypothetical protein